MNTPSRAGALALLLLACSGCLSSGTGNRSPASAEEVYKACLPSLVKVEARNRALVAHAFGSGFFVSPSGLVLTNAHVVKGAEFLTVRLADGRVAFVDKIVGLDPVQDMALLQVSGVRDVPALKIRDAAPSVGTRVYALGHPEGFQNSLSDGLVSGFRTEGDTEWVQYTAAISHGSSGGPVVDAQGRVLAMTTMMRTDGQSLNFAVPGRKLAAMLAVPKNDGKDCASLFIPQGSETTDHLRKFLDAFDGKRWTEALKAISENGKQGLGETGYLYLTALTQRKLGLLDQAMANLTEIRNVRFYQGSVIAVAIGCQNGNEDQKKCSMDLLKRSLKNNPHVPQLHALVGILQIIENDWNGAAQSIHAAELMEPDSRDVALAKVFADLADDVKNHPNDSFFSEERAGPFIQRLEAIASQSPEDEEARSNAAEFLERINPSRAAPLWLALYKDFSEPDYLLQYGNLQWALGNAWEAKDAYVLAKERDPQGVTGQVAAAKLEVIGQDARAASLWASKQYGNALELYLSSADAGSTEAMLVLARAYETGTGVAQDANQAADWSAKATRGGAMSRVASEKGDRLCQANSERDYAQAAESYRIAAFQGDVWAKYKLGVLHTLGLGVPKDLAKAKAYLREAASCGRQEAKKFLKENFNE